MPAATQVVPPNIFVTVVSPVQQSSKSTTLAHFTVRLSKASKNYVTFHYITAPGSAAPNEDYIMKSGYLTFKPGQTAIPIDVVVVREAPERAPYAKETFSLRLTSATNANIVQSSAVVTINTSTK